MSAAGLQDVGKALAVFLGEAVGGALGRRGLQVVQVPGLLLELDHARADVIEQALGEGVALGRGDVLGVGGEVADHLVDAVDADGGEVVAQGAQIALGVGKQPGIHVALDHLALDLQAVAGQLQQLVEAVVQARLRRPGAGSPGGRS